MRRNIFLSLFAIVTLLAVGLVWQSRIPPMADYPQHLMQLFVLNTFENPAFDWEIHYSVKLGFAPYSGEYFLGVLFSKYTDVETAGKLVLTVYVFLMAWFAWQVARSSGDNDAQPWGVFIFLPMLFHQMYFMGFVNYLLSLPVLMLALFEQLRISDKPGNVLSLLRQVILLVMLFLFHPYTFLVFIVLGTMHGISDWIRLGRWFSLVIPLLSASVYAVWMAPQLDGIREGVASDLIFLLPVYLVPYVFLPFTGMRWFDGVDWWVIISWLMIIAVAIINVRFDSRSRTLLLWVLLSFVGYAFMPYVIGKYAYFNLRMAPVVYLLFIWLMVGRGYSDRHGAVIVIACLVLIFSSSRVQREISVEKESIIPLFSEMAGNSRVLFKVNDDQRSAIDSRLFREMYYHDPFYYHIIVGGGFNSSLFDNPYMPVKYRNDSKFENIEYDYIIGRNLLEPERKCALQHNTMLSQSGSWVLYKCHPDSCLICFGHGVSGE